MKVNSMVKPAVFVGEDGERLEMSRSNRGEPYRDGIELNIDEGEAYLSAFLELGEVREMQRFLNEYLRVEQKNELDRCKAVLEKLSNSGVYLGGAEVMDEINAVLLEGKTWQRQ